MDSWKITKNDISYRFLYNWSTANLEYQSFCSYYRLVVLNILKVFCIGMVIPSMVLAVAIACGLPHPPIEGVIGSIWFILFLYGTLAILLSGCVIIAVTFFMIGYGCVRLLTYIMSKRKHFSTVTYEPQPNLVWTWIKAKKRNFCPLIEIVKD